MAEPSKHINYSLEDIQRYLQGKMAAAEMHAIEKAALQDPFLADAIEGFTEADLNTTRQHLNEINASLFAEKKESKVVAFNKKTQWLNIAALIIVLAGIGLVISYFVSTSSSSNKQTAIAGVKKNDTNNPGQQKPAFEKLNSSPVFTDTVSLTAQNKNAKKRQAFIPPTPKIKEEEAIIVAENKALKQEDAGIDKTETANMLAAAPSPNIHTTDSLNDALTNKPKAEEKQLMARSYAVADTPAPLAGRVSGLTVSTSFVSFSGKVVDESGEAIPYASVTSTDDRVSVAADEYGYFKIQKPDSLLNVIVSTPGFESKNVTLKQGINHSIVLPANSVAMNEVVVTGYGTKRKQNANRELLKKTSEAQPDSAMPVGGWNNFNQYVITQLNKDTTTDAVTNPNDLVELEFLIDKAGNPYNIKITRSINDQHNSKAVEILKNGPKWTNPTRKQKTKVVINF